MSIRDAMRQAPPNLVPLPDEPGEGHGSCPCGASWWGEDICHCAVCHLSFTTDRNFDRHRYGTHEPYRRRCRSEEWLRRHGYEPNENGHWRKPRPIESLPSPPIARRE